MISNARRDQSYWNAFNASKAKEYQKAINLYWSYLSNHPEDPDAKLGLCWSMWNRNQELIYEYKDSEHIPDKFVGEIKRYLNVAVVKSFCPTDAAYNLYSRFLDQALKVSQKSEQLDLLSFLYCWGVDNLQESNWEEYSNNGRTYDSLALRVIRAAGKKASSGMVQDKEKIETGLTWINKGLERKPEDIWLNWYKAKILELTGRPHEAESFLHSVLEAKSSESWAWNMYAKHWKELQDPRYIAALCKATCLIKDEDKSRNIRVELGKELYEQGYYEEAKREFLTVQEITSKFGLKPIQEVEQISRESWFLEYEAADDNQELYKQFAREADDFLVENIPWKDAVVGRKYTNKANKPRIRLLTADSSYSAKITLPELKDKKPGSPISIKVIEKPGTPPLVYTVKDRSGQPWDCLKNDFGVIDFVNKERKSAHVVLANNSEIFVPFDKMNFKNASVGDLVQVSYSSSPKIQAEYCIKTDRELTNLKKNFDDTIKFFDQDKGFGFTESGIFIRSNICPNELEEDDAVSGIAIKSFDKKKGKISWAAIKLLKINE